MPASPAASVTAGFKAKLSPPEVDLSSGPGGRSLELRQVRDGRPFPPPGAQLLPEMALRVCPQTSLKPVGAPLGQVRHPDTSLGGWRLPQFSVSADGWEAAPVSPEGSACVRSLFSTESWSARF